MKTNPITKFCLPAATALFLGAGAAVAQTQNYYVNSFPPSGTQTGTAWSNTQGTTPQGCGVWYGSGIILWDGTTTDTLTNNGGNSAYIQINLADQNCSEIYICPAPNDNLWYAGNPAGVSLEDYKAIHFDILWDTANSTIPLDMFNNVDYWPADYMQSWASTNYLASSDPNTNGLEIDAAGTGNNAGEPAFIGNVDIPDTASNGWVSVTCPINPSAPGLDGACGIVLKKWISQPWGELNSPNYVYFWIANVWFEGTAAPPPPPTLQSPTAPNPGLNIFASTEGNQYYDRQEVALVASNGVSWVGNATSANPVTYSFTINSFPPSSTSSGQGEAYLILASNPSYYDTALDYNETNAVVIEVIPTTTGSQMLFTSKVNLPASETYATDGSVNYSGSPVGTWSITFTSDTNVTLTAPDNTTSSFVFTNAPYFAETQSPGSYLYLGMQANNILSMNHAVCYSRFSISGVPAAMSDNFLADTTLNTNVWYKFMTTGPSGVFVEPPGAEYWLTWSTPAGGFQLQTATSLLGSWNPASTNDIVVQGAGADYELVTTNDIPVGTPNAFFELANP
jgi:hypothetical protein